MSRWAAGIPADRAWSSPRLAAVVREVVAVRGRTRPGASRLAYHGPDNEEGEQP